MIVLHVAVVPLNERLGCVVAILEVACAEIGVDIMKRTAKKNASFLIKITSYNKVTVIGTAASRVYFHLKAEAVRMGE